MKYKFQTRPYSHQKAALKKLLSNKYGGALFMAPRTGKTKVAIDFASILAMQNKINKVLIICPARVMDVWVEQIAQHSPLDWSVYVWDRFARSAYRQLPPPTSEGRQIVIVNYEAFGIPGHTTKSGGKSRADGRFKYRAIIRKWMVDGKGLCILDESHKIKSPSGKVSSLIVSLQPTFPYRLILTGTPVTKAKRAADLYMQYNFLDPSVLPKIGLYTHDDVQNYVATWLKKSGYQMYLKPREKNLERLRKLVHQDAFAIKREECFDLPEREDIIIPTPLSRKTQKIYQEFMAEMIAEFKYKGQHKLMIAPLTLTQRLRLAQLTGGVAVTESGEKLRISSEKLIKLKELLTDECLDKEQKVVVAARFVSDLDEIARLGQRLKLPVYSLRGGISRAAGTKAIQSFKQSDDPCIFLMQPASGSLGIDLSTSSTMVWYSYVESYVDYTQACDRIALSENSTTFYHFIAPHTIDELIREALDNDTDVATYMAENPERLLTFK